ncbi:MAG: RNA-binding cell elongation regulator Jag/EloR [Pseudomonadota bacterium]
MSSTTIEFEGKTVDEAIKHAVDSLGLPKEDLQIEVLSYGSTGIFGLVGTKKARVRAQAKFQAAAAKQEIAVEQADGEEDTTDRLEPLSEDVAPEETITFAREMLTRIIKLIGEDCEVDTQSEYGSLILNVKAVNSALLIGKQGQTLDALQYLMQRIVNKGCPGRVSVIIDVANYRERRNDSLKKFALRMAEKAKSSGKPVTLPPKNAYERRIIHMALQTIQGITTESRGGGYVKKKVIFPQKEESGAGVCVPQN